MILDGSDELVPKFYDHILRNRRNRGKRVLILCAPDVDALCALKILLHLFTCDMIEYTLEICTNSVEMAEAAQTHADSVRHMVLINCGARENCNQILRPGPKSRVFIIDSRRPVHLRNCYSKDQILVLADKFDKTSVPPCDKLYIPHYASDNGEWDEDDHVPEDDPNADILIPWVKERRRIVEAYMKPKMWHGRSSALKMFDLAYAVGKDDGDLFFWAVIGLCDMYVQLKITADEFVLQGSTVQGHLIRLLHSVDMQNQQTLKISYHHDLCLRFYRRWSVFESLKHTPYTASIFRAWESRGQKKLYEMLADMGFSLAQCRQNYSAMDTAVRTHMVDWFKEKGATYDIGEISTATFLATYGFNQKFQVNDMALGLFACLTVNDSTTPKDNFHEAMRVLEHGSAQNIVPLLELGKRQLMVVRNIVQAAIEEKLFTGVQNVYFQASLDNLSTAGVRYISRPDVLIALAHFLQRAFVVYQRGKRIASLPFVLIAEIFGSGGETSDFLYVVGLPEYQISRPEQESDGGSSVIEAAENYMGYVFDLTAEAAGITIERDTFYDYVVKIPKTKKSTFLEYLILGRGRYNEKMTRWQQDKENKENGPSRKRPKRK